MEKDKILEALLEQKETIDSNFTDIKTSMEDIDTRLTEVESQRTTRKVDLPGLEADAKKFTFIRALIGIRSGRWDNAGFEKEVFDNARKAVMATGTDSTGGYIVPTQLINDMIELLRAESVIMRAGATVLDNLIGAPVEIPKQTGGATGYWVGENQTITESNPTVGQIALYPKAAAALVKLSNRLLNLSNPSAEAMVRRDIAQTLALKIDLAALEGAGSASEPMGLSSIIPSTHDNAVAIGAAGGTFTYDQAIEMEGKLDVANALRGKLSYIMHPIVSRKLKSLKIQNFSGQSASQPYYFLPMTDAQMSTSLGYPFLKTTQIDITRTKSSTSDASHVYFGNWSELLVGQWGGLELMASQEADTAFATNQTWIRAIQEVDTNVRHDASFSICHDARTN